jgi:GH18 family chitinase
MKKQLLVLFSCVSIMLSSIVANAQITILGYYPSYRATSVIRYDKFTDLVFAFINSDTEGNLIQSNPADALYGFDNNKFLVVKQGCADNGVKLWISLGGADPGEQRAARLNAVAGDAAKRDRLATQIVNFAVTHNLFGIDVDWEFPKTTQAKTNHLLLLQAIKAKIQASAKPSLQLGIAVGGEYKFTVNHIQYVDASLFSTNANLVDKWYIMAYDFPATYNANHSSLADGKASLDGWNAAGVPYSKMLLGVPFYGRNSTRSGDIMYNELGGNNTVFTSDLSNGWYYNGKTTLDAKMDYVSEKGANGILIWDVGQDRTDQYSLLTSIDAKAATLCPVPKPNLGPDKGVCSGQATVLDSKVAAANGRTFTWRRDNNIISGSSPTLSINQAGTYKVTITQSGCAREDEILIVSGSSVTATGANGCNNQNLTLSVNNPDNTKNYKWFNAADGGNQLGTGTSYSAIFPTKTTVYVEESSNSVVSYSTLPTTIPDGKFHSWAGGQFTKLNAQMLVVEQDLTIKSVRGMFSQRSGCSGYVKVIMADNFRTEVASAGPFSVAGDGTSQSFVARYVDMTTNITLTPGTYFVYFQPNSGQEGNYGLINTLTQESKQAGVYTLKGSTFQSSTDKMGFNSADEGKAWWTAYGPFLDWKIETGANASCGRTAVTANVIVCGPPAVTINAPLSSVTTYEANQAINFSATVTDEGSIKSVTFQVLKGANVVATLTTNVSAGTYTSTWTPTVSGADYSFRVTAVDNDNETTIKNENFTVKSPVGFRNLTSNEVKLFPVPFTNELQVLAEGINNFDVYIYTTTGQLVETFNVSGQDNAFVGQSLKSGVYVVRVISTEGVYVSQVIKN